MKYQIIILILLLTTTNSNIHSQEKLKIKMGTGIVNQYGNLGIGVESGFEFRIIKNFYIGLKLGNSSSSDANVNITSDSYNHVSEYNSDFCISYNSRIKQKLGINIFAVAGIHQFLKTQMLYNSNAELSTFNEKEIGIGESLGIGIDYILKENYTFGINYKHNFFNEGYDYFGVNFGVILY